MRRRAVALIAAAAIIALPTPAIAGGTSRGDGLQSARFDIPADAEPVAFLVADGSGRPIRDYSVKIEEAAVTKTVVVEAVSASSMQNVSCIAYNSPGPTYSWTNHTLHYGLKATCNTPIQVKLRQSLWSGTTSSDISTWQDSTSWKYGTLVVSQDVVAACLDWGGYAYWKLFMYAEGQLPGGWTPFTPYPGTVTTYQECRDIA